MTIAVTLIFHESEAAIVCEVGNKIGIGSHIVV